MRKLIKNREPEVSILYFRPSNPACTALDGKLFEIASRNRQRARLIVKHTDESGNLFGGWVSGRLPTVLFVRDGHMVAQLVGDLPSNEIERLLQSALRSGTSDSVAPLVRSASN
jgi:thioredoxin-like negative regulator of GroEL